MRFPRQEDPIHSGKRNIVLLQQYAAVKRVFDVRRFVTFADNRRKMQEFRPPHENEPAEVVAYIDDNGDLLFLNAVTHAHHFHQRNVGAVDELQAGKSTPQE